MKYLVSLTIPEQLNKDINITQYMFGDLVAPMNNKRRHITLYNGFIPDEKKQSIDAYLPCLSRLELKIFDFEIFDENILVAKIKNNKKLSILHNDISYYFYNLIDRSKLTLPEKYANDPERVETFNMHGSVYFGKFYNPHISLFRTHQNNLIDSEYLIPLKDETIKIPSMLIEKKVNDTWQVVYEFKFE